VARQHRRLPGAGIDQVLAAVLGLLLPEGGRPALAQIGERGRFLGILLGRHDDLGLAAHQALRQIDGIIGIVCDHDFLVVLLQAPHRLVVKRLAEVDVLPAVG